MAVNMSQSTRSMTMDQVRSDPIAAKPIITLHGMPGIGKTSFGARAPKPIFLMSKRETGLETLIKNEIVPPTQHFPEIETWGQFLDAIETLIESEHDRQTVVIDTANGFEHLLQDHVCTRDFRGNWGKEGFAGYARGYDRCATDWQEMLDRLEVLRRKREVTIIMLCHTRIESFSNPEGEDYKRFEANVHKKVWAPTHAWSEMVLFFNYLTAVDDSGKGKSAGHRILYTQHHAAWDAKNRHNLPAEIAVGPNAWQSLIDAWTTAKGGK